MENVERALVTLRRRSKPAFRSRIVLNERIEQSALNGIDYKCMMDDLCIGIAEIGLEDSRVYFSNGCFAEMIGYNVDDFADSEFSFRTLVHEDDGWPLAAAASRTVRRPA